MAALDNPVRIAWQVGCPYSWGHFKMEKRHRTKMLHQLKYKHHPEIGVKLGKGVWQRIETKGLAGATLTLSFVMPLHHG